MEAYNDDEVNQFLRSVLRPIQLFFELTKPGAWKVTSITYLIDFSILERKAWAMLLLVWFLHKCFKDSTKVPFYNLFFLILVQVLFFLQDLFAGQVLYALQLCFGEADAFVLADHDEVLVLAREVFWLFLGGPEHALALAD